MGTSCPLCGQPLPQAIDENDLRLRLEKMTLEAKESERQKLEREFANRLDSERKTVTARFESARQSAIARANEILKRRVEEAREALQKEKAVALLKLTTEAAEAVQRDVKAALQKAELDTQNRLAAVQLTREREQVRHTTEMATLQGKLEELSRRLEKQTAEQRGEEAEVDLYAELVRSFPADRIDRIGRGIRGADILHTVMDGCGEAGHIVYESKNQCSWKREFIAQVKKYHTTYNTPCVMIVSRVLPGKRRGMCVADGVPIVEPSFAASLASVMRNGLIEISKLKLTKVDSDSKATELFGYVIGEEFQTRFHDLAEAIDKVQEFQDAERTWHQRHWAKESDLHERIQKRHSEIEARFQLILSGALQRKSVSAFPIESQNLFLARSTSK